MNRGTIAEGRLKKKRSISTSLHFLPGATILIQNYLLKNYKIVLIYHPLNGPGQMAKCHKKVTNLFTLALYVLAIDVIYSKSSCTNLIYSTALSQDG